MGKMFSGSQTSESKIPQYLEDASKYTIGRSQEASKIGHVPYYGPDVAALSPLQESAMRNTAGAASAFGMQTPQSDPLAQINGMTAPIDPSQYGNPDAARTISDAYRNQLGRDPDQAGFDFWMQNYNPETFANDFAAGTRMDPLTGLTMPGTFNGVRGYSSAPMFESAKAELQQRNPGQYDAINAPFINPQTGAAPQADTQQAEMIQGILEAFSNRGGGGAADHGYGGGGGAGTNGFGGFGGYSGLGDMFDGGGPGTSGDKFGGAFGGVSNALGKEPGKGLFGFF